ncbi:sensor histidine kinase [Cryptosporangium aurantiacum]|uniref:histidine kinase n=1 Tax=Cryptosporangium aurantiacum TaxID=134849 RepID=A0A1M7Q573_9ACTN|nr:HAMP domain-containing sensor histidine kinase [Cryptosporangium aurantiacum]SHN25436.1 two-component system, OmpR family, sensor kinase [Cryptosporangium aurantiacum]
MTRLPLWSSLLIGLLVLTAVALGIAGATNLVALRGDLVARTDVQLRLAASYVEQRMNTPGTRLGAQQMLAPTDYLLEIRAPGGRLVRRAGLEPLPEELLIDAAPAPRPDTTVSRPATVLDGRYRVLTVRGASAVVVVALSLSPVEETVRRLALVQIAAGAAVLLLLGLFALLLVRRGLRPLEAVTRTASAIAGGDLDRRVPARKGADRTEVGRLTAAVNGMLARIEDAVAARSRSEDQLRRFVADASHELRTPLTSIRGYVQMLRQGIVDERRRPDVLRRTDEEAVRMSAIVDDLLYLARLDVQPLLRADRVDLVALVRDAVSDALAAQPGRPTELDLPQRCEVSGDTDALRQVMANLLGNVRVHTPPDAPVRISLTADETTVRLEVADRGPGMSERTAARAFDRFARGASATAGSGLGLAIVAEIVEAHGGTATVRSEPQTGTTVAVHLPAGDV